MIVTKEENSANTMRVGLGSTKTKCDLVLKIRKKME